MKWIGIVAAQLTVFAAIGYGVYSMANVNQSVVPSWATSRTESAAKPPPQARSRSPTSVQRAAAGDIACEAPTWPNIGPGCVKGPGGTAPREIATAGTAQLPQLAKLARAPDSEPGDPSHTGSLPNIVSQSGADRLPNLRQASSPAREARGMVRSRTRHSAVQPIRKVRWAARPRRSVVYVELYPRRMAYMPWWGPVRFWR
jgi:hypothetical protein